MAAGTQHDDLNKGYYRNSTVFGDQVVFVSEDDLWTVQLSGGIARRLTAGLGTCSHPSLSPDGRWIAFSSAEEGHQEVYIIPSQGGPIRRLTYLANISIVVGWLSNEQILFKTDALDNLQMMSLCTVSVNGDLPKSLSLGPASSMSVHDKSGVVILERNSWRSEPAHWKRYRGGTAGKFYRADSIEGEFVPFLRELKGNLSRPFWFADRVLFLSDHEGIGNLYSCSASGEDVRRLTSFRDFYVRNPASDGKVVVFHSGADLYRLDPANGKCDRIDVVYASQRVQRQRKFVDPKLYLEDYSPRGLVTMVGLRGSANRKSV
jgi:tricorn protease